MKENMKIANQIVEQKKIECKPIMLFLAEKITKLD